MPSPEEIEAAAKAICERERGLPGSQCKACVNANYGPDDEYLGISVECMGAGWLYLAEVALRAAEAVREKEKGSEPV